MIENIINLLSMGDYYAESELIDFAKGSNEFTLNVKKKREQIKRKKAWLQRKR